MITRTNLASRRKTELYCTSRAVQAIRLVIRPTVRLFDRLGQLRYLYSAVITATWHREVSLDPRVVRMLPPGQGGEGAQAGQR